MGVATACQLGATPLDPSFRLADGHIRTGKEALETGKRIVEAAEKHLARLAVADSRLEPP